ncbi:MAG: carboxymuconolactone decarboxylase family protein [Planctomycetota bacterium]|nr:carboxymuconolactone decarboxylase family protein [Planctomycetota bacterium]
MQFDVHTQETAPAESRNMVKSVEKRFGFLPNLIGVMANAPPLLSAYLNLSGLFEGSSLTPQEQQIVLLTVSESNHCEYCVAAHSVGAGMCSVPRDEIKAVRERQPLTDGRLQALRQLTMEIVETQGWPSEDTLDDFVAAGFRPEQVLEVILGVGMKTLSNYTNHVARTPLDDEFAVEAWTNRHTI